MPALTAAGWFCCITRRWWLLCHGTAFFRLSLVACWAGYCCYGYCLHTGFNGFFILCRGKHAERSRFLGRMANINTAFSFHLLAHTGAVTYACAAGLPAICLPSLFLVTERRNSFLATVLNVWAAGRGRLNIITATATAHKQRSSAPVTYVRVLPRGGRHYPTSAFTCLRIFAHLLPSMADSGRTNHSGRWMCWAFQKDAFEPCVGCDVCRTSLPGLSFAESDNMRCSLLPGGIPPGLTGLSATYTIWEEEGHCCSLVSCSRLDMHEPSPPHTYLLLHLYMPVPHACLLCASPLVKYVTARSLTGSPPLCCGRAAGFCGVWTPARLYAVQAGVSLTAIAATTTHAQRCLLPLLLCLLWCFCASAAGGFSDSAALDDANAGTDSNMQ